MRFNIRVYGIWVKKGRVLLSHENINDFVFTKFPGGGVELGEGIMDALIREIEEETGVKIEPFQVSHFYTTDFFQQSAFNPNDQIVSIYYQIDCENEPLFWEKDESSPTKLHTLKTEWIAIKDLHVSDFTFPIDKKVFLMLTS